MTGGIQAVRSGGIAMNWCNCGEAVRISQTGGGVNRSVSGKGEREVYS